MDLITPEQRILLLANGRTARDNPHFDPWPVLKWFNPCGTATWLITELDPDDEDLAYGLCDLGIERDLHWRADKPISAYARLARAAGRIVS